MSQSSQIQNQNSHKKSKPPWNNHFTLFRSEDMMKRDPCRCVCVKVPVKTRIKKLLVSDKRYNNPNDDNGASKEPKHPYIKKCYCLDDMNLADHSNERFDDVKTRNNFSRTADKQEDDYPKEHSKEYPRPDVIDSLVSKHDQPKSRDFNSMTPKDIETLRKFRDKHYFECHSIEARIPCEKDKQKYIHKYEVNQRMFPERVCTNNSSKCHCYCTLPIGERTQRKIKPKPPKIHQSIPVTDSEEINNSDVGPRTNHKDTDNNNRKDVYFCCPNCPCHMKQRPHSQDNYNSRNQKDLGNNNSRNHESPDNYLSKRRQSQENYSSRRQRSPENYTSKHNHDRREHSDDDAERRPRGRTRDTLNQRHSQPKNYHDYTEFSSDDAERRPRQRTSENNRHRDSKTNGQDNIVKSEVPKYILKIPEVYIKFPITESMIVTEKRAEKNGKKCKCPCVKEYERRKSAPVNDSLALRHQQGYRRFTD